MNKPMADRVTEACSCGASISVGNPELDELEQIRTLVEQWRTDHRHDLGGPLATQEPKASDSGSLTTTRVSATADTRPPAFGFTTRRDLR